MNGEQLHALYRDSLADLGVDSDNWGQLDETDRDAWEATAAKVEARRPLSVAEADA